MEYSTRDKMHEENNLRIVLARRLKEIYFLNDPWINCAWEKIPDLIKLLEEKLRPFYQNQASDKIFYWKLISNVSDQDIQDLLENDWEKYLIN